MSSSSSSSPPPPPPPPHDDDERLRQLQQQQQQMMKEAGRDVRLSFRNFAEHQLRREFRHELLSDPSKCAIPLKAFAECAKEEGVWVVFNCRDFQRSVNECMSIYNSPQAWEAYKDLHKADLENRVISTDSMIGR